MKAYQFKITIKDTHPPIWRRVVVPAGISFNQLTLILNEAMGWSGYHLSSYTFQNLHLEFEDDPEVELRIWSDNEVLDAAEYLIDEYVEAVKSFTYVYDFGDYWAHQVQVEAVLPEYENDYPVVLKYKGDTPPEDCGGVWGYEEHLDIMSNPDHPEYEDHASWLEGIGYSEYDMDLANEQLSQMVLTKELSSPMSREKIYEDFFEGRPLKRINVKGRRDSRKKELDLQELFGGFQPNRFGKNYSWDFDGSADKDDDFDDDFEDYEDWDDYEDYWDDDFDEEAIKEVMEITTSLVLAETVEKLKQNTALTQKEILKALELPEDVYEDMKAEWEQVQKMKEGPFQD